jgi:virulence-associated protein VagC
METLTVTTEGDFQLVRLPKTFHIPGDEVSVRHEGDNIVLAPVRPTQWPEGFFDQIRIDDPAFKRPPQGELPPIKSWT